MKYKKYLRVFSVSIFAISALMIGSVNSANAGFWDWFGLGGGSQQAQVNTTTYKWVNNGLVSESSGRNTGTCAKAQTTTYTCSSSNVGAKLYDGTNRGSSYGDVGHAWPIYEGVNTSVATEYTYSGCGLDKRTGGQVNQWECKAVNTTTNSSTSSAIPTVQTIQPSNITTTSATLKGIVDPKDKTSKTYFEIFPDPNGGSYGMMTPQQTAVNYYGVQEFSFNLTNLKPGTTYTYYAYVSYYDSTTGTNKVIKDTVGKTVTTSFESNSNPIISVTSPNGGEIFKQGDVMTVSWKSTGIIPVDAWVGRIALYNNNGASFLIDLVPFLSKWPTSGSIQWLIPNNSVIGSDFKVQTILYKGVVGNESVISSDFSNASFTIASGSSSSSSSTAIPTVQTTYADNITSNYASLFGTVDTKDKSGKVYFEIFPDPNGGSYGMMTPQQSLPSSYVGSFGADVSNLKPGTVYKYYAVFTYYDSSTGNNKIIKDAVGKTFTTLPSAQPSITVLSPNGGEKLKQGDTLNVSWKSNNAPIDSWVGRIALYNNNGASFLIDLVPFLSKWPTSGSIQWPIPNNSVIGSDFKVQTILYKGIIGNESVISSDFSDASFTIASGTSSSSSSTAIPTVQTNYATNITASSNTLSATLNGMVDPKDKTSKVYFEIFPDPNGGSYRMLTPQQSVSNSSGYQGFSYNISNLKMGTTYTYYAVVTYYDSSTGMNKVIKDSVGKTFTTQSSAQASITVLSPNGGEKWQIGSTQNISFKSIYIKEPVILELYRDPKTGDADSEIINIGKTVTNGTGSNEYYKWQIPNNLMIGEQYKIRAVLEKVFDNKGSVEDFSDNYFSIVGNSSSSSSTSGGLTAITDGAGYSLGNTTLYLDGRVNNPNREKVYYYFNYRKETESSEQTKQTAWIDIGNSSFAYVSSPVEGLSPGTKYVYRLYAYSQSTLKTVSGELRSFTIPNLSSSSSSSSAGNLPPVITGVSGPTNLKINEQGIWTVKANDPENGYLTYNVCWGDNYCEQGKNFSQIYDKALPQTQTVTFSHSYSKIGSYNPIFTVNDDKGQSTKTSVSVNVGLQAYPQTTIINPYQTNSVEQASSYVFTRELGYGSSGNDVTELQKRLTSEGYYFGPITGYYGSMTVEAVKKYQSNNGIPVTGYVGPQTLSVLNGSGVRSTSSSSGSSQGTSLSQLVELFIALGIISPDKADLARASVKRM